MARDNPNLYVMKMSKRLRNGPIFSTILATTAWRQPCAALAPRLAGRDSVDANHLGTVECRSDPKRFTVRTAPALLAKSAWKYYCDALRPLEPAMKKLSKVQQAA